MPAAVSCPVYVLVHKCLNNNSARGLERERGGGVIATAYHVVHLAANIHSLMHLLITS